MKNLILILWISFAGCLSHPKIPISDTLEQGLGDNYLKYVSLLNRACEKDGDALHEFLKVDYLYDGATYDHGDIVLQLMAKCGDSVFSHALTRLSSSDLSLLGSYIDAGLDLINDSSGHAVRLNYPQSFAKFHCSY